MFRIYCERLFVPQLWFFAPYVVCVALPIPPVASLLISITLCFAAYFADSETMKAAPTAISSDESRGFVEAMSITSCFIIGLILCCTMSARPSAGLLLFTLFIKAAFPLGFALVAYRTFERDVFPALQQADYNQVVFESMMAQKKRELAEHQKAVEQETERVRAVHEARKSVRHFYAQRHIDLQAVYSDQQFQAEVLAAIPDGANDGEANAAAANLLERLQAVLSERSERTKIDRAQRESFDKEIATLREDIQRAYANPIYQDDPTTLKAEVAAIERKINDLTRRKTALLAKHD